MISQSNQMGASFNSIAGMSVFDENAKKIGTVKQVGVDASQNVVLVITKTNGTETAIKWNEIKKIGEIILLGKGGLVPSSQTPSQTFTPPQTPSPPPSMTPSCANCGFSNKPSSKFCESCGTKL